MTRQTLVQNTTSTDQMRAKSSVVTMLTSAINTEPNGTTISTLAAITVITRPVKRSLAGHAVSDRPIKSAISIPCVPTI